MEYKLDTEAIRKRFAEAVVIVSKDGKTNIALPFCGTYTTLDGEPFRHFNLCSGCPQDIGIAETNGSSLIRPGDRAEFSNDNRNWFLAEFSGFSEDSSYPFEIQTGCGMKYIRPLPHTSPEKVKVMEQIAKMEKELAELKSRAEKLECKPC
jgi:hypothetical protein